MKTEVNQTGIDVRYPTDSVHYFGTAYPMREVDGWKVFTERLEARLESDSPLLMEAMEMLEEFACFLSDEEIHTLSDIRNDIFKVEKNPTNDSKLVLTINRQPIGEWFKEQWEKLRQGLRKTEEPRKSRGFKL